MNKFIKKLYTSENRYFLKLLDETYFNRKSNDEIHIIHSKYLLTDRLLDGSEEYKILNNILSFRSLFLFEIMKDKEAEIFIKDVFELYISLNRTKEELKQKYNSIVEPYAYKYLFNKYGLLNKETIDNLFVSNYDEINDDDDDKNDDERDDNKFKDKKKLTYNEKRKEIKKDINLLLKKVTYNRFSSIKKIISSFSNDESSISLIMQKINYHLDDNDLDDINKLLINLNLEEHIINLLIELIIIISNLKEDINKTSSKKIFSILNKLNFKKDDIDILYKNISIDLKKTEQLLHKEEQLLELNKLLLKLGLSSNFFLFLNNLLKNNEFKKIKKTINLSSYRKIIKNGMDIILAFNIKLIIKESIKYKKKIHTKLPFDEILNVGIEGFLYSLQKFDIYKNIKLSTYSTNWIKQYIIQYINLNKTNVVSSPYYISKKIEYNHLMKEEENKEKPLSEIAQLLNINERKLNNVLKYTNQSDISIYTKTDNDNEGNDLQDFLIKDESNEDIIENLDIEIFKKILKDLSTKVLNKKDLYIFNSLNQLINIEPLTIKDVSNNIYLTEARVRQLSIDIEKKLFNYLKKIYENALELKINIEKYYENINIEDFINDNGLKN